VACFSSCVAFESLGIDYSLAPFSIFVDRSFLYYDLHCGFETWTGHEYVYYMLKDYGVNIPYKDSRCCGLRHYTIGIQTMRTVSPPRRMVRTCSRLLADFDKLIRAATDETRDGNERSITDYEGL
jgi:hypothetical protein